MRNTFHNAGEDKDKIEAEVNHPQNNSFMPDGDDQVASH